MNPELKRNLIAEAVVELRFDPKESADYSLIPGLLYGELKSKYSVIEDLNVPDFGDGAPVEMNYIPRHRTYAEDKKKLYSLGKGVISINTLIYTTFEDFLDEIMSVIEQHKKVSGIMNINRIGLRYINLEANEKKVSELFTVTHSIPAQFSEKESGFDMKSTIGFDADNMELRFSKKNNVNEYILDLDYHNDESKSYDITEIRQWIDDAHEKIYQSFKACLTEEFYNELLLNE